MTTNESVQKAGKTTNVSSASQAVPETVRSENRTVARIVGGLFITGTAAGILSAVVTGPVLGAPDVLAAVAANGSSMVAGAVLVLVMGLPLAMVPVMMFPIFRKYNEALALGSVLFRGALEAVTYIAMATSWLLLISLSKMYAGATAADAGYYQALGALLNTVNEQIVPIQHIVFSLGALMFYALFYQSRLIPRWLSVWGLISGVLYITAGLILMSGTDLGFLVLPLALQEMVMAVWLIVKGFDKVASQR